MTESHILIIEDEKKIASLVKDYLTSAGFKTTCLLSGDQAVEKIKTLQPTLVLLDLMLPGTDGITICREVRKFSDIPIIMVTAKVEEVDRLVGLEIGADDYICKPFSPREVVARVKAVLRRTRSVDNRRHLSVGPITLDDDTRNVTINETPLNLTPSEFSLLRLLMLYPDRVFSRSELIDKIQGYRFDGYDRTVDSHVKNLRKKIADILPGEDVIHTVYGVGYKLSL